MAPSASIVAAMFALAHMAVAAPSPGGIMKIHYLHDKQTHKVAIDVSAGDDSFAPVSRQFCGQKAESQTIDWDGFANDPLTVALDDNGHGEISFQGKKFPTTDCPTQWNGDTVIVECTIPYTGTLTPVLPADGETACQIEARGIAHLSPIHKRTVAESHLHKRAFQDFKKREAAMSLTLPPPLSQLEKPTHEKRQGVGVVICTPDHITEPGSSGFSADITKEVQVSNNNNCSDGTCSVQTQDTKTVSVGFHAAVELFEFISAGFEVQAQLSTAQGRQCDGAAGQTVCQWNSVPHKAYDVKNIVKDNCKGVLSVADNIRVRAPTNKPYDGAYCVRNACRILGAGYYSDDVATPA